MAKPLPVWYDKLVPPSHPVPLRCTGSSPEVYGNDEKDPFCMPWQDFTIENQTSLCSPMPRFARVPPDLYYQFTTIERKYTFAPT
jgi:hypothetical protein